LNPVASGGVQKTLEALHPKNMPKAALDPCAAKPSWLPGQEFNNCLQKKNESPYRNLENLHC